MKIQGHLFKSRFPVDCNQHRNLENMKSSTAAVNSQKCVFNINMFFSPSSKIDREQIETTFLLCPQ